MMMSTTRMARGMVTTTDASMLLVSTETGTRLIQLGAAEGDHGIAGSSTTTRSTRSAGRTGPATTAAAASIGEGGTACCATRCRGRPSRQENVPTASRCVSTKGASGATKPALRARRWRAAATTLSDEGRRVAALDPSAGSGVPASPRTKHVGQSSATARHLGRT